MLRVPAHPRVEPGPESERSFPVSDMPSGPPPSAPLPPTPTMPAAMATVPPGLPGWAGFTGVMTLINGVLSCLSCVGIIWGIPMIIAGIALMGLRTSLQGVQSVDPALRPALERMKTYVVAIGWTFIIGLVVAGTALLFYAGLIAAAITAAIAQN